MKLSCSIEALIVTRSLVAQTKLTRLLTFTAAIVLIGSWQTAFAQQSVAWHGDIAITASQLSGNGTWLWALHRDNNSTGNRQLYRYDGCFNNNPTLTAPPLCTPSWKAVNGQGAQRIAATKDGSVWMIDAKGTISVYNSATNTSQTKIGFGREITVGGDDSVWLVGSGKIDGGYHLYKWVSSSNSWAYLARGAMQIAAAKDGTLWMVSDAGAIQRLSKSGTAESIPGKARSIYAGLNSGAIWILGTDSVGGGYPISKWAPHKTTWEVFGGFGAVTITEAGDKAGDFAFRTTNDGWLYSQRPTVNILPVTIPATVAPGTVVGTITYTPPPVSMPPMTPPPIRVVGTPAPGKLICSAADGGSSAYCGDEDANFVGGYKLDTTCDAGFYDMIWGGSCWKCPDDDGRGGWIRGLGPVTENNACWREPKEQLTGATRVKNTPWPHECSSGTFWDIWDGGACWKCPDTHPRRTANHISWGNACATAIGTQEAPAEFLSYNGCPKPDAVTMNLSAKRTPGVPFLDIAAGSARGHAGGGCFACPASDENGRFLVTERNANSLYNDDNNGCRVNFKWEPPVSPAPGISGLAGVKELIWENKLFERDLMTAYLHVQAISRNLGVGTLAANTWVEQQWNSIATKPYSSDAFRTQIFALLKVALAKAPQSRTEAERKLISSFAEFIRKHRTYLAQQGLAMYDAWKNYHDRYEATRAKSSLETAFYYGTVPLGFNNTLRSLTGMGGFGIATVSAAILLETAMKSADIGAQLLSLEAGARLAGTTEVVDWARVGQLATAYRAARAGSMVCTAAAVSGPSLIATAGAIVASIAIDQFVTIQTARPNLVDALERAQLPVDLDAASFKTPEGVDQIAFYWGKAMDTAEIEDAQVIQVAAAARNVALANGYWLSTVFAIGKQGGSGSTVDTTLKYLNSDGRWSVTINKGVMTLTSADGLPTRTGTSMTYLGTDGMFWESSLQPDGKTFRHRNILMPLQSPRTDGVLSFKNWIGENCGAVVLHASGQ